MGKKLKLVVGFVALAIMAAITGVCFVFFGNNDIKLKPESISVEKIGEEYYVVAQYNSNYKYRFVLEQKLDDQYYIVDKIVNDTNTLKLSEQKIILTAGAQYRFSACYTTNNNVDGKMSEAIEWQPTLSLGKIEQDSIEQNENYISWGAVYQANQYEISVVSDDGNNMVIHTEQTNFSLNNLNPGHYKLYLRAQNTENEFLTDSAVVCFDVNRRLKNELVRGYYSEGSLRVYSTFAPKRYQIFLNGSEYAILTCTEYMKEDDLYVAVLNNCGGLFSSINLWVEDVQIKSLGEDYLLESDLVIVR